MIRKLLCLIGWHDEYFAWNHVPAYEKRATAGLWLCEHCDHQRWHWYYWVKKAGRQIC